MEPGRNPVGDLEVIEQELQKYGGLEDRPRLVALNKVDVPDGRDMADIVAEDIAERGWPVFPVSAASHEGLRELMFAMAAIVAARRAEAPKAETDAHRDPADVGSRRHRVHGHRDRRGLARARREARALDPADRLQQRRGRRASSPTGSTGSAWSRSWSSSAPSRATPCSSATPTTPSSSTSSPASTPARRCSAAAARTSGSTSRARRPSAAAPSTQRCRTAPRARPGPTWPVATTRSTG